MDRKSVENMKLDKRLIGRRGWIAKDDLQRALEALPDVTDKVAADEEEPDELSEAEPEAIAVQASGPDATLPVPEMGSSQAPSDDLGGGQLSAAPDREPVVAVSSPPPPTDTDATSSDPSGSDSP